MAATPPIESVFNHHQNCYIPNQHGVHRFVFKLRVSVVHVHMRDMLSKPLVVIS